MTSPRLTILMPAYNAALYISEAIESLLNQTFRDFELWILNDGSTDNTWQIIESFSDSRIKKFSSDVNKGRVGTVNEYITRVKTEYLTVTDADDVSVADRLQQQIELMDRNGKLVMCGTSYFMMNEKGIVMGKMILSDDFEWIRNGILTKSMFLGGTTVMRTSALERLDEFYRAYFKDNRADTDLSARMTDLGMCVNIVEPLYLYRTVTNSLSRRNYSPRFVIIDQLICFLTAQRRENGADCLMSNNLEVLKQFELEKLEGYNRDTARIHYQGAFYHLYWGVNKLAFQSAVRAFWMRPFYPKSIFVLLFVIIKGSVNSLRLVFFGKHYNNLNFFAERS
ncbi:MAG: glycosyltransferase family 2 protein [Cyclobacteriaceae bacterium]